MDYTLFQDLKSEVTIPGKGMLSRTLYNDDRLKVIVFGFAQGHELKAHAAPMPAAIYIVEGHAHVKLDADGHDLKAGAFVHMAPRLEHAIYAQTPLIMLLLMIK